MFTARVVTEVCKVTRDAYDHAQMFHCRKPDTKLHLAPENNSSCAFQGSPAPPWRQAS
jgi:hypothetical protein